jgi:hypothetical protein
MKVISIEPDEGVVSLKFNNDEIKEIYFALDFGCSHSRYILYQVITELRTNFDHISGLLDHIFHVEQLKEKQK